MSDNDRWNGFRLRAGDIIVTTPPKCGTTWTQMCCLVLLHGADFREPLSRVSPWIDQTITPVEDVHALLDAQEHRRVIKTHTPLDGLPFDPHVTYIGVGRDPRDVSLSSRDHFGNMDMARVLETKAAAGLLAERAGSPPPPPGTPLDEVFQWWLSIDELAGLKGLVNHQQSLWDRRHEPNVLLLHYADMKRDVEGEMRRLAAALDIDVPEEQWPALVAAVTLDAMRDRAEVAAPNADVSWWRSNQAFFSEGRLGAWREVLSPASLARYEERLAELCPDEELRAWLHTGS